MAFDSDPSYPSSFGPKRARLKIAEAELVGNILH